MAASRPSYLTLDMRQAVLLVWRQRHPDRQQWLCMTWTTASRLVISQYSPAAR